MCALAVLIGTAWAQARPPAQPPTRVKGEPSPEYQGSKDDLSRARRLLQLGMGSRPMVNVRAIIFQRIDANSSVMQQIQVEMSTRGKIHQIVLAPMSYLGYDLVDDGITNRTYSPDDKTLVVQPSSQQDSEELRFRMKLVDQNYRLAVLGKDTIAGRSAMVIEAAPKNSVLETRCYSVDEKNGLLLRLETCRGSGKKTVQFETKMVEFPEDFSEDTFKLDPPMGVSVKKFARKCVTPEAAAELTNELGFRPVVPSSLPYGFEIQQLQSSMNSGVPALSVRITDGLAKATVFQWRHSGPGAPPPAGTAAASTGRLTLLISGDLPEPAKQAILQSFVKAARTEALEVVVGEVSWAQELPAFSDRFDLLAEPEEIASLLLAIPFGLQI